MNSKRSARNKARSCFWTKTYSNAGASPLRAARGNMLVFITACTIGLLAALAFFGLGYVRLIGTNNEQRTAIEAAALAAARDLSMIAINTNNVSNGALQYGWISLSDYAPNGSSTKPTATDSDGYDTPVRGMNTILGTIRLDLVIADQIGDANLVTIIKQDLTNALAAQALLNTALQDAIKASPEGTYHDINGNQINVYTDAQTAYTSNQIRMTGSSNYVANSLQLSLGCQQNGTQGGSQTNIPIPVNANNSQVPSNAQQNRFYSSYINVPYTDTATGSTTNFVFSGIGTNIKLVDPKLWLATPTGMPASAPNPAYLSTIVRAQASQLIHAAQNSNGNGYTIQSVACAQPANVVDPRPAPGALAFSFPDGLAPELVQPADMLSDAIDNTTTAQGVKARILNDTSQAAVSSYSYASGGDFPNSASSSTISDYSTWPYASPVVQNSGNVFRQALYDWWKRAGCTLDVSSASNMMKAGQTSFSPPTPLKEPWTVLYSGTSWVGLWNIFGNGSTYYLVANAIPAGIMEYYEYTPSGSNSYQIAFSTNPVEPSPYEVASENQLYSENLSAIAGSSVGTFSVGPFMFPATTDTNVYYFQFQNIYDLYILDQVYNPGSGAHGGEPLTPSPVTIPYNPSMRVAPKIELGSGGLGCGSNHSRYAMAVPVSVSQPPVVKQSVFAENCYTFSTSAWYVPATGTGVRPSYQKNGMAVDIVLRREVCPYKLTGPGMWAVNTAAPGYVGPDDWSVSPSGTAVVAPIPPVTSTSLGVPSSTNNTTTSTP